MNKMDELLRNIAIDCLRKANLNPQLEIMANKSFRPLKAPD